jgi:methionyl-tRNA synthetase
VLKNFYVSTPIYYVNDRPHIGHSYTSIAVDFFARFNRLAGREAFFVTGTDEHGTKVANAAEAKGMAPQAFCNEVVQHFVDAWKTLNVDYNYFVRTTDERHEQAIRKLLTVLNEAKTPDGREAVYPGVYEGLYCTGCEKFLTEGEIIDGNCSIHKTPAQHLTERNYFFRLEPYLPIIKEKVENNDLVILPDERRREVLGLLRMGLPDFSISRESVTWGIKLPFDPSQVAYVWVDALPNYISAIGYGDDPEMFDKWWTNAEVVHIMAKDILKFHCVYWPAMLMAAGLKCPDKIFIHGYATVNGEKMGKSAGNQIDPHAMTEIYGVDATRYLLLNQYPFGADGDIKETEFVARYNADLANDLGNLVSRVAKMINQYCDGRIPEPQADVVGQKEMMSLAEDLPDQVFDHVRNFRITDAIGGTWNLIRATNRFLENAAPWKLAKNGDLKAVGGVLYTAAELVRVATILLFPIMPEKMREVRKIFGLDDSTLTLDSARTWFDLPHGNKIAFKTSIFPRLDADKVPSLITPPREPGTETEDAVGLVTYDQFSKMQLRVAEVILAEKVKGADKLLQLQIDLGSEKRQIVAGIAQHYTPEDMVGKKIVVVANLEPAKIRGIESRGMLLAAQKNGQLTLVTVDKDIPPGASVN